MKKLLFVLILVSTVAQAENEEITPFPNLKMKEGINIVKSSDVTPSDVVSDNDIRSMQLKGYIDTNDVDGNIKALFSLEHEASNEIKSYREDNNPQDTHLKLSYQKIPLSFKYSDISTIKGHIIGYAAAGGYSKQKGWDGIAVFFKENRLGICSYTTYAIKKVLLAKEKISYSVNKKPTTKSVKGNPKIGFLYSLNWYEDNRLYSLECANKTFDPERLNDLIVLANTIEKATP